MTFFSQPPRNQQGSYNQPYQQPFSPFQNRGGQPYIPPYMGGQEQFYTPYMRGGQQNFFPSNTGGRGQNFFPSNVGRPGQNLFPFNAGGQGPNFSNSNSRRGPFGNLPTQIGTFMNHAGTINNGLNMMRQLGSFMGFFR